MLCSDVVKAGGAEYFQVIQNRLDYALLSVLVVSWTTLLWWNVKRGSNMAFVNIQSALNLFWALLLIATNIL